jgi:leucyl/phenylalanyl-tRNA--protein transferase
MSGEPINPPLQWLENDTPFPSVTMAWGPGTGAPGLLAAGGDLQPQRLVSAYSQGIFPWFSQGQPVLWWSPSPRMVLQTAQFKMHRSLAKTLQRHHLNPTFALCFDRAFDQVIENCARAPRKQQAGTWIVPAMVQAYQRLHRAGHAHSAEVWLDGDLVAGLYFVCLGKAVFGESMFTQISDGSKMALSALVHVCQRHGIAQIDCQQNTPHLASLGAQEMPRSAFLARMAQHLAQPSPDWTAQALDGRELGRAYGREFGRSLAAMESFP